MLWAAESSLFAPPGIALEQSALSLHTGRLDSGTGLEVKDKVLRILLNKFRDPQPVLGETMVTPAFSYSGGRPLSLLCFPGHDFYCSRPRFVHGA